MLTQPKKSAVIVTRVTPVEREAIINRARRDKKSVSEYMRDLAVNDSPKPEIAPASKSRWTPASSDGESGV